MSKSSIVPQGHDIKRLTADLRNNAKVATISRKAGRDPNPQE